MYEENSCFLFFFFVKDTFVKNIGMREKHKLLE